MKKPIYKRIWFWIIFVIIFVAIGNLIINNKEIPAKPNTTDSVEAINSKDAVASVNGVEYKIISEQTRFYKSQYGDYKWEALVEIKNTGKTTISFGINNFDLENETGKIIETGSFWSSRDLLPGEKTVLGAIITIPDEYANTKIVFKPRWDIYVTDEKQARLEISDVEFRDREIVGRVTNPNNKDQPNIYIHVYLYGDDGKPIGFCKEAIRETIKSGETISFKISTLSNSGYFMVDGFTPDMVATYEIHAYY